MSSKNNYHIIALVKKYPLLYDPSHPYYKSLYAKNKTWELIGRSLKMTSDEAKSKWKNLRDTYNKYLKSSKTGDKSVKNRFGKWHWGPAMNFLKEYLATSSSDSNVCEQEVEEKEEIIENNIDYSYYAQPSNVPPSPRQSKSQKEKAICSSNETASKMSSTEHIMIGYAKVLDGMTAQRRIETKMKIAEIMMQAELEEEEERLRQMNTEYHVNITDPLTENDPILICKADIDEQN